MTALVHQYRALWDTESGGSGFSVFHAAQGLSQAQAQAWATSIRDMFFALTSTIIPADVTISFPGEVLELNTATGELAAVVAVTPPTTCVGSATGAYSAPSGGRIRWNTAGIVGGRRVAGTTFIVPLISSAYDDAGTLSASTMTTLSGASGTYLATQPGVPVVYSRPFEGADGIAPRPGTEHVITSQGIPDRVAVLRSRRD